MSDRYDVAARLAEGKAAVERFQTYVQACQTLGYQQPDLTGHASQVGDWYDTEVGLDLQVLDGDAAELRAALTAVDEALSVQRTQATELAAAWRGSGAESAARFIQQHCDAAEAVAAHIRAASECCATLRDDLWQAVDGKVATTVAIDELSAPERSAWLAAAGALRSGGADRSAAEVMVHQQVMPYVDSDIRNDWLAAMSAASASVAASYDAAIHALTSMCDIRFDIPGDLGPRWLPTECPPSAVPPVMSLPAGPLSTAPAAAPAPQPVSAAPQHRPAGEPEVRPPESTSPLGESAGSSTGAGGLGGVAGGIGGVVGSIVDGIGSLIGALTGGLGDVSGDPPLDDPVDVDQPDEPADENEDHAESVTADEPLVPDQPGEQLTGSPPAAIEAVDAPAAPPPIDSPPVEQTPPTAGPPPDGSTPCEIAEDQLPQAGQ